MQVKSINKNEVSLKTTNAPGQVNVSQPANYKAIPPIRSGISVNHLFSLFTADIITQDVVFIR